LGFILLKKKGEDQQVFPFFMGEGSGTKYLGQRTYFLT
jgi:hypothetical protein